MNDLDNFYIEEDKKFLRDELEAEKAAKELLEKENAGVRGLILQFIASIALCNHMGDVSNDVNYLLKKLGIQIEWEDFDELCVALGKMGITTLYGTTLIEEDE